MKLFLLITLFSTIAWAVASIFIMDLPQGRDTYALALSPIFGLNMGAIAHMFKN